MKRIKAIFSSLRTLGQAPNGAINDAWANIKGALANDNIEASKADLHLIEQVIQGVAEEAAAWTAKQDKEAAESGK